jgi:hypothetical protein
MVSHEEADFKYVANSGAPTHIRTEEHDAPEFVIKTLPGTAKVAGARRVWGPRSKIALAIGA